jgi:hypothetical protein
MQGFVIFAAIAGLMTNSPGKINTIILYVLEFLVKTTNNGDKMLIKSQDPKIPQSSNGYLAFTSLAQPAWLLKLTRIKYIPVLGISLLPVNSLNENR